MRIRDKSLIILISSLVTQATTIVMGIILVRMISQEDFGTYRQVLLVQASLAAFLALQFSSNLYYFIPKVAPDQRRGLLAQTIVMTLITAAVQAGIMFVTADFVAGMFTNPELGNLIRVFSVYPFIGKLLELIPAFMISIDRPGRAGIYSIAKAAGRVTVVVLCISLGGSLWLALVCILAAEAAVAIIGCIEMFRFAPPGRWSVDWKLVWQQLDYAWPFMVTVLLGRAGVEFDKVLVSSLFDPATFAVYSCGAVELPLIGMISASMANAMMPRLVTLADRGQKIDVLRLWQESCRKAALVLFPCFIYLLFISRDFMVLLYGTAYAGAGLIFAVYLLEVPFRITVWSTLFRATGQSRKIAASAILGLGSNVVFSLFLVWVGRGTTLQFVGPAIGTIASTIVIVGYYLTCLRKTMNVAISQALPWKMLGGLMAIAASCGALVFLVPLPHWPLPVRLGVCLVAFVALYLIGLKLFKVLKPDEARLLSLPLQVLGRLRRAKPSQTQ